MAQSENFINVNLALGVVIGFEGISGTGKGSNDASDGGCCDAIACCDSDSSSSSDGCDSDYGSGGYDSDFSDMVIPKITWLKRAILTIQLYFLGLLSLAAQGTEKVSQSLQVAFYVGPEISIGPLFFTGGTCLGQFGCLAIGGGIHYRGFGIGILIPVWIWW